MSFVFNHHHFFICNELPGGLNWVFELEIDLRKNKAFRDGAVFEIGEKDDSNGILQSRYHKSEYFEGLESIDFREGR